jgi:hypothetical protein
LYTLTQLGYTVTLFGYMAACARDGQESLPCAQRALTRAPAGHARQERPNPVYSSSMALGRRLHARGQALTDGQATKQWMAAPCGHGWSMYTKPNTPLTKGIVTQKIKEAS